jgi:hypothetical protein
MSSLAGEAPRQRWNRAVVEKGVGAVEPDRSGTEDAHHLRGIATALRLRLRLRGRGRGRPCDVLVAGDHAAEALPGGR